MEWLLVRLCTALLGIALFGSDVVYGLVGTRYVRYGVVWMLCAAEGRVAEGLSQARPRGVWSGCNALIGQALKCKVLS